MPHIPYKYNDNFREYQKLFVIFFFVNNMHFVCFDGNCLQIVRLTLDLFFFSLDFTRVMRKKY